MYYCFTALLPLILQLKIDIVQTLLDRKINLGARDGEGFTARDYLEALGTEMAQNLMQMMDSYVINKVSKQVHPTSYHCPISPQHAGEDNYAAL